MKQLSFLLLVSVMLVVTGCPLQTNSPVDEGSYTETSWLEGKWDRQASRGSEGKSYVIKKHRKPGNILAYDVINGTTDSKGRLIVLSNIGSTIFISAFEDSDDLTDKGYYIYKMIKKSSTEFDLLPVKENSIAKNVSGKDIRAYLNKNQDADIYEKKDIEHYKKNN